MGIFTKDMKTLDDLFAHQLKDIYYAEKRIVRALPGMVEKATAPDLKQAFENHLAETKNHVARVEQVFELHGIERDTVKCPAIDGILDEADDVAGEAANKQALDIALVAAAQTVEHYEMSRYGTLIAWATELGRPDCAKLLQQNLDDEKAADKTLTHLALSGINHAADLSASGVTKEFSAFPK